MQSPPAAVAIALSGNHVQKPFRILAEFSELAGDSRRGSNCEKPSDDPSSNQVTESTG